jgi:hypothetical protein
MKDSAELITMESNRTVTDIYFNYWYEHIRPLEQERRRAAFAKILVNVIANLYGSTAALDLGFKILGYLVQQNPPPQPHRMADNLPVLK